MLPFFHTKNKRLHTQLTEHEQKIKNVQGTVLMITTFRNFTQYAAYHVKHMMFVERIYL